mmetsp:Transcript_39470/g.86043  ORF Transcript_39470/g.86043 Transcript_39470/m.86043 type:complete len:288 (-) Transcript_39470:269-1132(-)|eukprot:CAMPEP_0204271342 /NCGR_PEP_ID=MMETSP0468-20130131/19586_1 /ASSEMBLY_ACC=CAM_ASM_000383 /TAXON_ID=2969 /ORGANISM="Oxyrrhis marina" /LENGTH=287 /DNA_ID=CAMNT_0051246991 /DNA_START=37 /DNA_END=900 /DNA_ORIENTATION=-
MGSTVSSLVKAGGSIATAVILLSADLVVTVIGGGARLLVGGIDRITGAGEGTARKKLKWHDQKYSTKPVYAKPPQSGDGFGELDVAATLKQSSFPIAPEKLVEKAKGVLASEFGTGSNCKERGEGLSDDFQFVAPIVGPLTKKEFVKAFGSFKVKEALPDLADNSWFTVDPLEPNRVWFISRATGTHTGVLRFATPIQPTGKRVEMPPQAASMLFNEQGECYTLTVGYCMDKRIGNTEGLGGLFGILKAVGKALPFPEAQRLYNPSMRFEGFERIAKAGEAVGLEMQ